MSAGVQALIERLIEQARQSDRARPALIGVSGAQGSGKSFHCRGFAAAHPGVAHFSLDDVYLTRRERRTLARQSHPLFITRGPPGTHDLDLADATIDRLDHAAPDARTPLPRFDKAKDDRVPQNAWPVFAGKPEAILVDGWCLGARQGLLGFAPLNALERDEDADGQWRALVDAALGGDYADFFAAFDAMLYLQAPSWEIVRAWRGQQEQETLGRPLTATEHAALDRFVAHYERVTGAMLAGHHSARWIVRLDAARAVTRIEER